MIMWIKAKHQTENFICIKDFNIYVQQFLYQHKVRYGLLPQQFRGNNQKVKAMSCTNHKESEMDVTNILFFKLKSLQFQAVFVPVHKFPYPIMEEVFGCSIVYLSTVPFTSSSLPGDNTYVSLSETKA
jgi:hypothetical protein